MRLSLFLLLLTLLPILATAQIPATTEDGERVLLHEDGTWTYAGTESEEENRAGTTQLQTGSGERMRAGIRESISNEIKLQIALEDESPRLVMWKEGSQSCSLSSSLEFGEASLLLGGSATISLVDRGRTGKQTVTRSIREGMEIESSYCQSWGIYHLTDGEVQKLKSHPLSKVRIHWDYDPGMHSDEGNEIISVDENRWTLRRQIEALGL